MSYYFMSDAPVICWNPRPRPPARRIRRITSRQTIPDKNEKRGSTGNNTTEMAFEIGNFLRGNRAAAAPVMKRDTGGPWAASSLSLTWLIPQWECLADRSAFQGHGSRSCFTSFETPIKARSDPEHASTEDQHPFPVTVSTDSTCDCRISKAPNGFGEVQARNRTGEDHVKFELGNDGLAPGWT